MLFLMRIALLFLGIEMMVFKSSGMWLLGDLIVFRLQPFSFILSDSNLVRK